MLQNKNNNPITHVFHVVAMICLSVCLQPIQAESIHIGGKFSANEIIPLDHLRNNPAYLSVYGKCLFDSGNKGLARIILVDEEGGEFLVGEWDKRFCTDSLFSDMCIETANLQQKRILYIKVIAHDAILHIDSLEWLSDSLSATSRALAHSNCVTPELRATQWNKYNAAYGMHWVAGRIDGMDYSYDNIKSVFYCDNDDYYSNGMEYYAGGLFELDSPNGDEQTEEKDEQSRDNSTFVSHFDWRNRHGKNWITSVKNQILPEEQSIYGNGGCWAFGPIAATEAITNLYFNQLLNIDLSEQEVGVCTGSDNSLAAGGSVCASHGGGYSYQALTYIKNSGVCDENCFPFVNNCTIPCSYKCTQPTEQLHIANYTSLSHKISTFKESLIHSGPIVSGLSHVAIWSNNNGVDTSRCGHCMCMVGYGTIAAGDALSFLADTTYNTCAIDTVIPIGDPLIGKTYWIFKNSYGETWGHNGYMYAVFPENSSGYLRNVSSSYKIFSPITSINYSDYDIAITDSDNDGYYFWGLGPKPANCPICCPDIPDGDDSDPTKAEMDTYGNFATYSFPYSTLTVSSNTTWNTNRTQCGNIIVTNNATLTITAELTMNPAAKIIVQDGGTVIVDAGSVVNATVDVQSSSKIILRNNGTLYLKRWGDLNVHLGAEADITYGRVLLQ